MIQYYTIHCRRKGTASRCGSWKAEVAMSFVNYSIIIENAHLFSIEKQFLPFSGKEVHYNQLKAIFPCFSGFDVFRMALNVEEMAVRLWGPVEEERALQLGALAASSSVLMKPLATDDTVIERVRALFPQEVFPTATDSKASLCARLKESSFIQAKTVLKHGNGKGGYVQLNSTCYPQPRRVQWSAVTVPEHVDEDGDKVVGLLGYPHRATSGVKWK